jgi:uncharacterized protein (TIGR00106 family)
MKVIVDLCVVPIGMGVHLAPCIAACEKVLTEAGLKIQLHPNGTAIEGEWEQVFAAIEGLSPGGARHGLPPHLHQLERKYPHRQGPDPGRQGGQRAGPALMTGHGEQAAEVV